MPSLYESHRPTRFSDVVGQDRAVAQLRALLARGLGGRALWLTGSSGTGKTTLARIVASELASPYAVLEVDAKDVSLAWLRSVRDTWAMMGLPDGSGRTGRVYVVNEAHGLSRDAVRYLLTMLEAIPGHVTVLFTTTRDGEESLFDDSVDAGPLKSRTLPIPLSRRGGCEPYTARACAIAIAEGLDGGLPPEQLRKRVERMVKDERNNLRAVLCRIEAGELIDFTEMAAA